MTPSGSVLLSNQTGESTKYLVLLFLASHSLVLPCIFNSKCRFVEDFVSELNCEKILTQKRALFEHQSINVIT